MKRHLLLIAALSALAPVGARADEGSWIFAPAYYSHSPATGERVAQYCPEMPAYTWPDDTYQESAYRHDTTNIIVGASSDHQHIVQTWGRGEFLRPYGEWEFPFRAGATPFGPWGNPQGPWTLPFDSWQNPYGLGQLPYSPWSGGSQYGPRQRQFAPNQQFNGGRQMAPGAAPGAGPSAATPTP